MNPDQESLLPNGDRDASNNSPNSIRFHGSVPQVVSQFKRKRNLILLLLSIFIATCLTIYLYLNLIAIYGNQSDPSKYKPLSRRKPMLDHESIFSDSGPSMLRLSDLFAHLIVALQVAGREVSKLSLMNNNKLGHVGSKGRTLEGENDIVTGADIKSHRMILNTIKDSYRRLNVVSEEDATHEFENIRPEDDILPIDRKEFASLLRNNLHEIEGPHAEWGSLIAQHKTLVWIDPLDATKEYSENLTDYVTLMACIVNQTEPIAGIIHKPFSNTTYWAIRDLSVHGKHHYSPALRTLIQNRTGRLGQDPDSVKITVSRSHSGDVKELLNKIYGDRARVIPAGGSGYKTIELITGTVDAYIHTTHIKKWDICAAHAILNSIPGGRMTDLQGHTIEFGDPKEKVVTGGLLASLDEKTRIELLQSIATHGN